MSQKMYDDSSRIKRLESIVEKQQAEINRLIVLSEIFVKSLDGLTDVVSAEIAAGKR